MPLQKQLTPGMTISLNKKLYRVESCVKVTVPKGTPFLKTKLRDLVTQDVIEKNFKPDQDVQDVSLAERKLEFLYLEGKNYLFLDVGSLEQILIPASIISDRVNYLKEGVELKASLYGDTVFSVELPQFLELMVTKVEMPKGAKGSRAGIKVATLETGAEIDVPPFIEVGDIIKVDTKTDEYIQRV
jgi:elongation factor P